MNDSLVTLFCSLVSIPSPSGHELAVGRYIQNILAAQGITATFDGTGHLNDSDSGNLIARVPGTMPTTILFVAHMDTVEVGDKTITPLVTDGVITSDGTTILGADNKAAVAPLIEALCDIAQWEHRPTVIAAFTTREESGTMGSSVLDLPDHIDAAFNLDDGDPIGTFVYQTLGEIPFTLRIIGRAAHAAIEPEKGVNALSAAAHIITQLPIGKTPDGVVLNVGKIQGGTGNNVVPGEVTVSGQVRAFTHEEIATAYTRIEHIVASVCTRTGCTYVLTQHAEEGAPPAALPIDHSLVHIAQQAAADIGVPFALQKGSFCTDANFLSRKFPIINVNRGGRGAHAHEEAVSIESLHQTKQLIMALTAHAHQ